MLGILTLGQEYLNDFISDLGSPQKNRYILFFSLTSQFVALAIDSISDDNITWHDTQHQAIIKQTVQSLKAAMP